MRLPFFNFDVDEMEGMITFYAEDRSVYVPIEADADGTMDAVWPCRQALKLYHGVEPSEKQVDEQLQMLSHA